MYRGTTFAEKTFKHREAGESEKFFEKASEGVYLTARETLHCPWTQVGKFPRRIFLITISSESP